MRLKYRELAIECFLSKNYSCKWKHRAEAGKNHLTLSGHSSYANCMSNLKKKIKKKII